MNTEKTPLQRILHMADSTDEMDEAEYRVKDIRAMNKALNDVANIAREEVAKQEELKVAEQRNGDGDTLKVMRAVQQSLATGAIEMLQHNDQPHVPAHKDSVLDHSVGCYRITAKHADRFDAECMSFNTWARAAIRRGEIKRERNGRIEIYDTMSNGYLHGRRCMPTSGHKVDYQITIATHYHSTWTAIPRTEATTKAESAKKIRAVNGYLQPLWDLMHEEHGLILVETEMHDIMAACKEVEKRLRDEAPALEEWEECSAREADQFSVRTVFTDGIWSPWQDVPSDMRGKQTGFSDLIRHRRRKPVAEAQGGECEHGLDVRLPCGDCQKAYEAEGGEAALVSAPRPALDVQAAIDYLVDAAKMGKSIFWGRLWRTIANALQAGIGGGE